MKIARSRRGARWLSPESRGMEGLGISREDRRERPITDRVGLPGRAAASTSACGAMRRLVGAQSRTPLLWSRIGPEVADVVAGHGRQASKAGRVHASPRTFRDPTPTLQWLQHLAYDPIKDFAPVTELFYFPAVHDGTGHRIPANDSPRVSRSSLVTTPQAVSPTVRRASALPAHLLGDMLQDHERRAFGARTLSRAAPPMNMDTVLGRLDSSFSTFNFMNEYRKAGKVKFLAVAMSERSQRVPELPTMAEAGISRSGLHFLVWTGCAGWHPARHRA